MNKISLILSAIIFSCFCHAADKKAHEEEQKVTVKGNSIVIENASCGSSGSALSNALKQGDGKVSMIQDNQECDTTQSH